MASHPKDLNITRANSIIYFIGGLLPPFLGNIAILFLPAAIPSNFVSIYHFGESSLMQPKINNFSEGNR